MFCLLWWTNHNITITMWNVCRINLKWNKWMILINTLLGAVLLPHYRPRVRIVKNELGWSATQHELRSCRGWGSQWNEQGNWGIEPPTPRQFEPCIGLYSVIVIVVYSLFSNQYAATAVTTPELCLSIHHSFSSCCFSNLINEKKTSVVGTSRFTSFDSLTCST